MANCKICQHAESRYTAAHVSDNSHVGPYTEVCEDCFNKHPRSTWIVKYVWRRDASQRVQRLHLLREMREARTKRYTQTTMELAFKAAAIVDE